MTLAQQGPNGKVPRHRLTHAEQARLDEALFGVVGELHPITVRGVFYQAENIIPDIVEKSEKGYGIVQRRLVTLRKARVIPYSYITDGTRWRTGLKRYDDMEEWQVAQASLFRLNYWAHADVHVEVWLEKDALAGTIYPVVVDEWGVDLMVNRGFASITYLYEAARFLDELGKETHILLLSDFDPSGKCAAAKVEQGLLKHAPGIDIHVHEVAVTLEQIDRWELPTRPTKIRTRSGKVNTHYRSFEATYGEERARRSVELDAIRPDMLRSLVGAWIAKYADAREIGQIKIQEQGARDLIRTMRLPKPRRK
jgi:hypothetical protein